MAFVRFVLSSGKDSMVKLWEIGSGRMVKEYRGAKRIKLRSQVTHFSNLLRQKYSLLPTNLKGSSLLCYAGNL